MHISYIIKEVFKECQHLLSYETNSTLVKFPRLTKCFNERTVRDVQLSLEVQQRSGRMN